MERYNVISQIGNHTLDSIITCDYFSYEEKFYFFSNSDSGETWRYPITLTYVKKLLNKNVYK